MSKHIKHMENSAQAALSERQRRALALLRLYPPAWRRRYGDELAAVLEQHTITLATMIDLLWGALDARLDPSFTSERVLRPMSRLRASAVALFCVYAAFTLGYGAFARLTDPRAPFDDAAQLHPELGVAFQIIIWATLSGLLALALGGVPIALDIALRAWRAHNWRTLTFLFSPIVLFGVAGGFFYLANNYLLTYHPSGNVVGTPGDVVTLIVAGLLLMGSGVVSTLVVGWTVARSQISLGVLRFARWPGLLLTLCMATATGALIYWTVASYGVARWLYDVYPLQCGADCPGLAATNQISLTSLEIVIGWMTLLVVIAVVALARGFTTPRDDAMAGDPVAPQPSPARA